LLLFLKLDCTASQRSIPLEYLLQLLVQCYHGPFSAFLESSVSVRNAERFGGCGSGVFIGAEVDGEGGRRIE